MVTNTHGCFPLKARASKHRDGLGLSPSSVHTAFTAAMTCCLTCADAGFVKPSLGSAIAGMPETDTAAMKIPATKPIRVERDLIEAP